MAHVEGTGGRGGWGIDAGGGGSVEQNAYKKGGSEGCFTFISWLIETFDFLSSYQI